MMQDSYVAGNTDTDYLPRVYPDGFTIPKLSESHMNTLKAVSAVLESCRYLRMKVKATSWDFVVSDQEKSTAINVTKVDNGFLVNLSLCIIPWNVFDVVLFLLITD